LFSGWPYGAALFFRLFLGRDRELPYNNSMIITSAVLEAVLKNPNQIAVVDLGEQLTYGELRKRMGQLSYLYLSELPQNKNIGFLCSNSLAMAQTFLAISNLGNPMIVFSPELEAETIAKDIKALEISYLLITSDQKSFAERIKREFSLDFQLVEIQKKRGGEYDPVFQPPPDRALKDTNPVLIVPQQEQGEERKYVFFNHQQLYLSISGLRRFYRAAPTDRFFTKMNWSHPFSLSHGMLLPLFLGSTCVVDPQSSTMDEYLEFLAKERVTRFVGSPKFYFELLQLCLAKKYTLPGVKSITVGMGALSLALRKTYKLLKIPILRCYGRAEAIWSIAMDEVEGALEIETAKSKPLPGFKVKVLNSSGDEITGAEKREGPLAVMADTVMSAYFHPDKELAAQASRLRVRGTWLYTGEIARLEGEKDETTLAVLGRVDDMLPEGKTFISPRPIDERAKQMKGISDAAGFVMTGRAGERFFALAAVAEARPLADAEVISFLAEKLRGIQMPNRIFWVDRIPRDEFAAIQRGVLARMFNGML